MEKQTRRLKQQGIDIREDVMGEGGPGGRAGEKHGPRSKRMVPAPKVR